jgi:hypothetical protein
MLALLLATAVVLGIAGFRVGAIVIAAAFEESEKVDPFD